MNSSGNSATRAVRNRNLATAILVGLLAALTGCDGDKHIAEARRRSAEFDTTAPHETSAAKPNPFGPVGGKRPASVYVPTSYDPKVPMPLVVMLHSYGTSGEGAEASWGMREVAERRGYIYAVPEGTRSIRGKQFWNATSACCDVERRGIDDSAYLRDLILDIASRWNVDRKRIFVIGLSNGAFMAHRLACDHADLIAGIVAVAGMPDIDPSLCKPTQGVHIAYIHGTADTIIHYEGGTFAGPYPSAEETLRRWIEHNGCGPGEPGPTLDADVRTRGAETQTTFYTRGCKPGGSVEFFKMIGGDHYFQPNPEFRQYLADYFFSHAKP